MDYQLRCRTSRFHDANYLTFKQIGNEDVPLVAVRFDPNVDLIVSLLAILKAGFSYLPIAPDWPDERIEYLLEDAKPLAILTNKNDYHSNIVDIIHFTSLEISCHDNGNLQPNEMYNSTCKDTYAVIYTSGSSGLPKGKILFLILT